MLYFSHRKGSAYFQKVNLKLSISLDNTEQCEFNYPLCKTWEI